MNSLYFEEPVQFEHTVPIINFIIPITGREEQARRFFDTVRSEVIENRKTVHLTLVYFESKKDSKTFQKVKDEFTALLEESSNVGNQLEGAILTPDGTFSRGRGLQIGAESRPIGSLLFMVDIDMVFKTDLLTKIVENTKMGQAFMPIVLSQYEEREKPEDNFYVSTDQGFWRSYGYGMIAIYKEDLLKSGGYDLNIKGWGMEDIELCDAIIKECFSKKNF